MGKIIIAGSWASIDLKNLDIRINGQSKIIFDGKTDKILDITLQSLGAASSTHSHTKSQITDFPASLPANGGNADTVDGYHAASFGKLFTVGNVDLNTSIDSGFYRMNTGLTNTPGFDWGQMFVSRGSTGDTVAQIAINFSGPQMMFRGGNPPQVGGSGKYYAWTQVIDRSNFNPTKIASSAPASDCLWAW